MNPKLCIKGKKGRPVGFRLSEASKRAISEAKKGQRHKESTKDKISRSLKNYFRQRDPLSEEIVNRYCRIMDDRMCTWAYEVSDELDDCRDILTNRAIANKNRIEIAYGVNIEEIFSHNLTPELILMFKQEAAILGLEFEDPFKE